MPESIQVLLLRIIIVITLLSLLLLLLLILLFHTFDGGRKLSSFCRVVLYSANSVSCCKEQRERMPLKDGEEKMKEPPTKAKIIKSAVTKRTKMDDTCPTFRKHASEERWKLPSLSSFFAVSPMAGPFFAAC